MIVTTLSSQIVLAVFALVYAASLLATIVAVRDPHNGAPAAGGTGRLGGVAHRGPPGSEHRARRARLRRGLLPSTAGGSRVRD